MVACFKARRAEARADASAFRGGEHLDRARAALNRADIPTIGPLYYWLSEQEVIESKRGLLAVLDAETAEEAKARVRDNLPANRTATTASGTQRAGRRADRRS